MRDGPFNKLMDHLNNPIIKKLKIKQDAEKIMLHRLQQMRVQFIDKEPEWKDCFNISFDNPSIYNRKIILNIIASKLVHDDKFPIELAKSNNCFWVKIAA